MKQIRTKLISISDSIILVLASVAMMAEERRREDEQDLQ